MARRKFVCLSLPNCKKRTPVAQGKFVCTCLVIMTLGDLDKQGDKGYFQILVKGTPKMWMWSDGINTTKQLPNGVLALYTVSIVAVPYDGNGQ